MVEIITDKKVYEELWKGKGLSLLQSWQWGEVKRGEWGVLRIAVSGVPVTIFTKKFPFLNKSFGYVARGFGENVLSKVLLQEMVEYCRVELKLSHLVFDPDLIDASEESLFSEVGFKNSGKTIQPNQTNFIDLSKGEDELWMELRAAFRRNIKKAERFGCKVEVFNEGIDPVGRFWNVMEKVLKKKKFGEYTYGYYKKAWDEFSKDGMGKIFVVSKVGQDLASYLLLYSGESAYELYGGVLDEGKEFRPGHLLKWKTILDAKQSGYKIYDQWGVAKMLSDGDEIVGSGEVSGESAGNEKESSYDKEDELYYISIFKEGFGGRYVQYIDQQTYVFDKALYALFNLARSAVKLRVAVRKKVGI